MVLAATAMFSGVAMEVDAWKTELSVAGDTRAAFLVEPFCFLPGGSLDFSVSNFKLTILATAPTPAPPAAMPARRPAA